MSDCLQTTHFLEWKCQQFWLSSIIQTNDEHYISLYFFLLSGFSRKEYRELQRMEYFSWQCNDCSLPVPPTPGDCFADPLSSTTLGDGRNDEVPEPEDVSVISHDDPEPPAPEPMDQTFIVNDQTFIVNDPATEVTRPTPPVDVPLQQFEPSLLDDPLPEDLPVDGPVTYQIIEGGSQKGQDLLVDNRGHSFTVKRTSTLTTFWACSVRNKKQRCPATISQRGRTFVPGRVAHCHPSKPGVAVQAKMAKKVCTQLCT